jgi:hypothetical protein
MSMHTHYISSEILSFSSLVFLFLLFLRSQNTGMTPILFLYAHTENTQDYFLNLSNILLKEDGRGLYGNTNDSLNLKDINYYFNFQ